MKRIAWLLCALLVSSSLFPSHRAQASGFSTLSFMPDYATAVTTSPMAIYTNPAALVNSGGLRLFFDGTFAMRKASYQRTISDTPEPMGAAGANVGRATLFNTFALPSLAASLRIGDFAAGVGVLVPFGGAVEWNQAERWKGNVDYPGAVDSPARWHTIDALWATGYATAAAAYRFARPRLAIGVSGNYVYSQLELNQAATATLTDEIVSEGRMRTELSGMTGSFGLGVQWEPVEQRVWLGLSYQAPPGLWGRGLHMTGPLYTNFAGARNKSQINLDQAYPDIIQAGMRVRPTPTWEVRFTGNYIRWSAVKSQCLSLGNRRCTTNDEGLAKNDNKKFTNFVRQWHDSFGARLSNSIFFAERYEVIFALSIDGTAVPDATLEPGIVDGTDVGLTAGSNIRLTDNLRLGISYMHLQMFSRDNTFLSRLADYERPNNLPSANGKYEQWVGIANVNLTSRFDLGF